jgi:3'(2'), 5'-bisphosphate nucleotidase
MPDNYLPQLIQLARSARESILEIYEESSQFPVHSKSDFSPLTQADLISHEIVMRELNKMAPEIPVLSEEGANIPFTVRQQWQQHWLVDPIDGTKEFIQHTGDFTINIALIEKHRPILGLIYVPVTDVTYFASEGKGAFKQINNQAPQPIHHKKCSLDHVTVAVSRYYKKDKLDSFMSRFPNYEVSPIGSALKFCLLAEGKADIYPRLGNTCEWDTAAGQIILTEAGGAVVDLDLQPLQYNIKDSLLNSHFIAIGDAAVLLPELKQLVGELNHAK